MERKSGRRSIFRALFVPMIFIMIIQALIFYLAAMYGGIEESLTQNAADILSERLYSRKSEVETHFNNRWSALDDTISALNEQYAQYADSHGEQPLVRNPELQIDFLADSAEALIDALRYTETNGVFLIVNDALARQSALPAEGEQKYGLCIRDMDQDSNYSGKEDLLLERAPSSVIDMIGCPLDSWWEAKYSFSSMEQGDYFYAPLAAAWAQPSAKSKNLAYLSDVHQISGSDPRVVSYSLPLISDDGFPYGVLGVELSVSYLSSLLPSAELGEAGAYSYILALCDEGSGVYEPVAATGTLFTRCFGGEAPITRGETTSTGGFSLTSRNGEALYAAEAELNVYNNNNPFESRRLVLLAVANSASMFSYISQIRFTLMVVSFISLLLGVLGLALVSRRFASPITALAKRVRTMDEYGEHDSLGHLGITEIDQLVDSIEELNRNVSRNSARSEFFSRMSHDMRTPMNAIISFSSEEMLENADEATKNDYLDKIHSSGVYLLGLINEVLDMTKIESNQTGLRLAPVSAAALFETPVNVASELSQQKNISFTVSLDIPQGLRVVADEQHISQIVMNLLSNAVKFTPTGGAVRFCVSLAGDAPEKKLCRIVVSDTGIGMSAEFMKKLYTPFEQENGNHEGTGLGLSIAKKLVELMDGKIECESVKNVGTTFTVTLPLALADENKSAGAPSGAAAAPGDISLLRGKRVLVCEDNEINTRIIKMLLERVGLTVDVAEDGKRGVELINASAPRHYAAVLMDIRMPVMDGLAASRAIRALPRADAAAIPIIAMTADAFAEDEAGSLAAGMNAHLSKPVEPQKLYKTLLEFMG